MEKEEYIRRLRRYLCDTEGKIWKDSELEVFLDKALDDYCEDTGSFRRVFDIHTNRHGVARVPFRYRKYIVGWNVKSRRIRNISARELSRFHAPILKGDGLPEYIYEDLDSEERVRFYPNPYKLQKDKLYYPYGADDEETYYMHYPYGLPVAPSYGTPLHAIGYGIPIVIVKKNYYPYGLPITSAYGTPLHAIGYGIPLTILKYRRIGEVYFIAFGTLENVFDYAAILQNAAYQAYSADSDFADSTKAQFYKSLYDKRVARFNQVSRGKRIQRKSGNYF